MCTIVRRPHCVCYFKGNHIIFTALYQEYMKGECLTALCCLLHVCIECSGSFVSTSLCPVTHFAKSNYLGCKLITYCHAIPDVDIDNNGVIISEDSSRDSDCTNPDDDSIFMPRRRARLAKKLKNDYDTAPASTTVAGSSSKTVAKAKATAGRKLPQKRTGKLASKTKL